MASTLCGSCKSAAATVFCKVDADFLCPVCDSKLHPANKCGSQHARVWLCEVCEQAPAQVTCKADAASLCITCDEDIHSANPVARRHERVPVTPFYHVEAPSIPAVYPNVVNFLDHYLSDVDGEADASRDEAEAVPWILLNPPRQKIADGSDVDPYADFDYASLCSKLQMHGQRSPYGVVPVQNKNSQAPPLTNHLADDIHTLNISVSSSAQEAGVIPDRNNAIDASKPSVASKSNTTDTANRTVQLSAMDREARVLRYREKRKNRKFEKTIRYVSRKAYAETRPRIKGRFAKRTEAEPDRSIYRFGVVPSLSSFHPR